MANTSAIWQQAAHTTYQLSSPSCSTRAIQKSLTLNEKYLSFLEKSQENGSLAKRWQDRKSKRTWQKNKQERRQEGESNDSPEIPDRRMISDIPSVPSGIMRTTALLKQFILKLIFSLFDSDSSNSGTSWKFHHSSPGETHLKEFGQFLVLPHK